MCAIMNQNSLSAPILSLGYLTRWGAFIKDDYSEFKNESHSARLDSSLVVACHLDVLRG